MNNFQFQIFRELIKQSKIRENMVISPLSIYNIISLNANGAANKTLEEMVKALCNKSLEEINKSINSEIHNLKTVKIANAIFTIFDKSKLEKNFLNVARRYKAHVDKLASSEKMGLTLAISPRIYVLYIGINTCHSASLHFLNSFL